MPSAYVESAVAAAHAAYTAKNPASAQLHAAACADMPGGNTRTVLHVAPFALTIASGAGGTLTSADGHAYTDFLGEYSAGLFGHSHPAIAAAVTGALAGGWNYGGEGVPEKKLAAALTARFGAAGLELVRFTNSGTEANTTLLGAALAWTGRRKILVFSGAFHGSTAAFPPALCRWLHGGAQGDSPVRSMNLPHEFVAAPWNNAAETKAVLDGLPADSLAAILLEPVQGAGGCRPVLPEFLQFLRAEATARGALLIVDEVMASRLGPAGTTATLGVRPDLLSLGKWIGGGLTFGAFGGRRDVMALFDPAAPAGRGLMHPGTFNNNAFTMAAGVAGLGVYDAAAVADLNARGERLRGGLTAALFATGLYPKDAETETALAEIIEIDSFEDGAPPTRLYAGPGRDLLPLPPVIVAGRGSMVNLRFTGADAGLWHNLYYHHMLARGLYLASRGYTPLNLALTDADVDRFVGAAADFLEQHAEALKM